MRVVPYCVAALLLAGCGARLTPSTTGQAPSAPFPLIAPMDQQTGGSTVKEVVVTGSRIPKPNLTEVEPFKSKIVAESPENDAFVDYDIPTNLFSVLSTGAISPSTFIVDASGNLVFTSATPQSKVFRLQLSPTGPPVLVTCNVPNPANGGLTQLPNFNYAISDTKNHFDVLKWQVGLPCGLVHSYLNPDGTTIHSLTSDSAANIDFADSKHFGQLNPTTGTVKVFYTPTNGSLLYMPQEIRFSFGRLVFDASAPSGTAGEVGELSSSGSLMEHFFEPSVPRNPYGATMDGQFNIWYVTDRNLIDVINPSGILKTLTNSALPATYQSAGATVGSDGQIYWDAPNSNILSIYNHVLLKQSPTSLSIARGATAKYTIFELLEPYPGTVPTTFSFTNAKPTIAKILSVTQSAGEATVMVEGLAVGTDTITAKDGTGLNITFEPIGVH